MSGFWRLTVRDEFSAGHALRGYKGKCENIHGHNFAVELSIEGDQLDSAGMLLDFGVLKRMLRGVLGQLDHCLLNDAEPFITINPSSENIARHIAERIAKELTACPEAAERQIRISSVAVSEKGSQTATWIPDQKFPD